MIFFDRSCFPCSRLPLNDDWFSRVADIYQYLPKIWRPNKREFWDPLSSEDIF